VAAEVTVEGCPRCGDQTLWSHNRGVAWCRLCGHTWAYPITGPSVVFQCDDPEAEWIEDQKKEAS
jgi:ribosomal protein S27E